MVENNLTKVPKFLKRLFRETSDDSNIDIVWSDDGNRVRIVNKDAFIKSTLPSLSKTKEYSAFIRQLNIYGFVKVKCERSEDVEEYYNCFFKQNQPSLMNFMKRVTKPNKIETQLNWPSVENTISFLSNSNYRLNNEIVLLKERVDKQERTINGLLDILGRVFRSGIQNTKFESPVDPPNTTDMGFQYSLGSLQQNNKIEYLPNGDSKDSPPVKSVIDTSTDDINLPDMDDVFF